MAQKGDRLPFFYYCVWQRHAAVTLDTDDWLYHWLSYLKSELLLKYKPLYVWRCGGGVGEVELNDPRRQRGTLISASGVPHHGGDF